MKKNKSVILIYILFLILPLIISIWSFSNSFNFKRYDDKEELNKFMIDIPKLSNGDGWIPDGLPISEAHGPQWEPQIVSDGQGGAIIAWIEFRSVTYYDIYAQKVDSDGNMLWSMDAAPVCTALTDQWYAKLCSDNSGGAIFAWPDYRNGDNDIYVQRIDSNGNIQWLPNGTAIATSISQQNSPQICSDGTGGAIITWSDRRSLSQYDIYAQKIDSSGITQWTDNGTIICSDSANQYEPQICSDGAGGAIITWEDYRSGSDPDIYAQLIDSNGITQWSANGTVICSSLNDQYYHQICSNEAGGAIITWNDARSGVMDIYAQNIDSSGNTQWTDNGTVVCSANNGQLKPQICRDGAGGAIITWYDYRSAIDYDIYAQKIDSVGNSQWTGDGNAICTAIQYQYDPQICSDGVGGAIITWYDIRSGSNYDIYAQKVDTNGNLIWLIDGVPVCNAEGGQEDPKICSDGAGSAIIAWVDDRSDYSSNIYAQRVFNYTGDTEITLITPESKLYTEPTSSYYPATFGFENDEIGDDPDDWSVDETGGIVQIISSHLGHSNVVELHETSDDITEIFNDIGSRTSGTVEWWASVNRIDDWFGLGIYNGDSNDGIHMSFANDGYLKYNDGSVWTVIMPYSANMWYHFRIEWDSSTDWHLWINQSSQDGGLGYFFRNTPSSLDRVRFQISDSGGHQDQFMFADAVGYSWDSNYDIGNNLEEGLFLGFELNNSIFALGYTLDNQNNVSISGNTTIPLPKDGPHKIRVYGKSFYKKFTQSEVNSFILDTKNPEIIIHSPSQSDVVGEKPPFIMVSITEVNLVSRWYTIDDGANNYEFSGSFGLINADAWKAVPLGPVTIRVYVEDIAGNIVFEQVTITKELDLPVSLIFNIVIISMFGVIGALIVLIFREINTPRER